MTRNDHSESATIYTFPAGGRRGVASKGKVGAPVQAAPESAPHIVFGGGWYHDVAIEEERTRHN